MTRLKPQRVFVVGMVVFVVGVVAVLFTGDQGFVTFYRTWRRMKDLRGEMSESRQTVDSLEAEVQRLGSDTAYIERIARENYGMTADKEKMFKFIEEKR